MKSVTLITERNVLLFILKIESILCLLESSRMVGAFWKELGAEISSTPLLRSAPGKAFVILSERETTSLFCEKETNCYAMQSRAA